MRRLITLFLLAGATFQASGQAGWDSGTVLDINGVEIGSHPSHLTRLGDAVFFRAWEGGARRPYRADAQGYAPVAVPAGFEDREFRPDGVVGSRLLLKSTYSDALIGLADGGISEVLLEGERYSVYQLGRLGRLALYRVDEGEGFHVWVTDGTPSGTSRLSDAPLDGTVVDVARDSTEAFVLTKSDDLEVVWAITPRSGGLRQLAEVPGSPHEIVVTDGFVLTASKDPEDDLLAIDRTTGSLTSLGTRARSITPFGDQILAARYDSGQNTHVLYRTDGTFGGTALVATLPGSSAPVWLGQMSGLVFFEYGTGETGRELWRTDGTSSGTFALGDLNEGVQSSSPVRLLIHEGWFYFFAESHEFGEELWVTDGTIGGTRVIDINPGPASSFACYAVAAPGGGLWVSATRPEWGQELIWLDPDTGETSLVANIAVGSTRSSEPRELTSIGSEVVFRAWIEGEQLAMRTDGTMPGSRVFGDYKPSPQIDLYFHVTRDGTVLALERAWGQGTSALWRLQDEQSTRLASAGRSGNGNLQIAEIGDQLVALFTDGLFAGSPGDAALGQIDSEGGTHLLEGQSMAFLRKGSGDWYTTDGTTSGTVPIPGTGEAYPWKTVVIGDSVLAIGRRDREDALWLIGPGGQSAENLATGSNIMGLYWAMTSLGNRALFFLENWDEVFDPWVTYGTQAGTYRLDTGGVELKGRPRRVIKAGERVFVTVRSNTGPTSLWVTDAAREAHPILVRDEPVILEPLLELDGELLFVYDDGVHGPEPWITEGDSTRLFADVYPGEIGSWPQFAARAGDRLFLDANTPLGAKELVVFRFTPDRRISEGDPVPPSYISEVYPNPAAALAHVTVRSEEVDFRVTVYNLLGQEVLRGAESGVQTSPGIISIPTGSLASGLYLLRISAGEQEEIRRFTVVR